MVLETWSGHLKVIAQELLLLAHMILGKCMEAAPCGSVTITRRVKTRPYLLLHSRSSLAAAKHLV